MNRLKEKTVAQTFTRCVFQVSYFKIVTPHSDL